MDEIASQFRSFDEQKHNFMTSLLTTLVDEITEHTAHLKQAHWIPYLQLPPILTTSQKTQQSELNTLLTVDNFLRMEMAFVESNDVGFVVQRSISQVQVHHNRAGNKMEESVKKAVKQLSKPEIEEKYKMSEAEKEDEEGAYFDEDGELEEDENAGKRLHSTLKCSCFEISPILRVMLFFTFVDDMEPQEMNYPALNYNKMLAMYLFRHVRVRGFRKKLLNLCNYYRSIEKKITTDLYGLSFPATYSKSDKEKVKAT